MKLRLLTVGLVTCLTFGLSYSEASATSELSTTCGDVQINTKPYLSTDELLTDKCCNTSRYST